jgi:hypothetical protein
MPSGDKHEKGERKRGKWKGKGKMKRRRNGKGSFKENGK